MIYCWSSKLFLSCQYWIILFFCACFDYRSVHWSSIIPFF